MKKAVSEIFNHFNFHKMEIKPWLTSFRLLGTAICLIWLALLSFTISSLIYEVSQYL
jgi:hypothetical protein